MNSFPPLCDAQAVRCLLALLLSCAGALAQAQDKAANAVFSVAQLRNGERRSVVQAKGQETFMTGDPVILVTTGGKTRVMRAPAVAPAASASNG